MNWRDEADRRESARRWYARALLARAAGLLGVADLYSEIARNDDAASFRGHRAVSDLLGPAAPVPYELAQRAIEMAGFGSGLAPEDGGL